VVVVADEFNNRLSLWRLGDVTVWKHLGSQGREPGQFIFPLAVAVTGAGALMVTDQHRVQVLTVDGAVLYAGPDSCGWCGPSGLRPVWRGLVPGHRRDSRHGFSQPSCGGAVMVS
jgi:hypothetical protein